MRGGEDKEKQRDLSGRGEYREGGERVVMQLNFAQAAGILNWTPLVLHILSFSMLEYFL
jgi:hypothetical protein